MPEQQSVKKNEKEKENIVKKKLVVPRKQNKNIPEDKKERKKFIQKMKRRIIINKHDNCNQFLNSYDKNRKCLSLICKIRIKSFSMKKKRKINFAQKN